MRSKKVITAFMLMAMVVCMATPAVQAANSISKSGNRQYTAGNGYRSYTRVTGYTKAGVALNMTAGASMGYDWYPGYGKPTASVYSGYVGGAMNAYHAYTEGGGEINLATKWMAN